MMLCGIFTGRQCNEPPPAGVPTKPPAQRVYAESESIPKFGAPQGKRTDEDGQGL